MHDGGINDCAITLGAKKICTGGVDRKIKIFDLV